MFKVPGEIQLSKLEGDEPQYHRAFVATSWLMQVSPYNNTKAAARTKYAYGSLWYMHGTSWSFDGLFQQNTKRWSVECRFPWDRSFDIQELDVYPIRFADHEVIEALRKRGKMFWECRWQKYVCYHGDAATRAQSPVSSKSIKEDLLADLNVFGSQMLGI